MNPEEIKKVLEDHLLWLDSNGKKGQRADFRGANLREANLREANLQEANLQGTKLPMSDLKNSNLFGANLKMANLLEADLSNSTLHKTELEWANLHYAKLKMSDLKNSNLFGANLTEANLTEANLTEANLFKANLRRANLQGANLREANLLRANLRRADLKKADLYGASLENTDLQKANLYKANLERADLSGANTLGANFDQANFEKANLTNIIIDRKTASNIPLEVIEKYGSTLTVLRWADERIDDDSIVRSIEFPPEYHQAGISILNYFGTVLRNKYPDQKARIKIEQEELKVTMIIDPLEGDSEVIERALDEYGLVVTGEIPPEEFINDPIQIIELKNELRIAKVRIESQKELLHYQNVNFQKLYSLLSQAIQNPIYSYIQVDAKSKAEVHLSQEMQFVINLTPMIHGGLNELKEQFKEGTKEADTIQELQNSLDNLDACNSKDEIKKSSAVSKFRRFLENVEKAETTAGKIIKTTKDGIDIARKLAGYYNDIAQWCGLPQVPKPFTKKRID